MNLPDLILCFCDRGAGVYIAEVIWVKAHDFNRGLLDNVVLGKTISMVYIL